MQQGTPTAVPECSRRLRAALHYAPDSTLGYAEIARRLEVDQGRVRRLFNTGQAATPEELEAIAEMCEVPVCFLRHGWPQEPWSATPEALPGDGLEGRVDELAEQLAAQRILVGALLFGEKLSLDSDGLRALRRGLGLES